MKQESVNENNSTEFDSLLAESINNSKLKEGTIIKGKIAEIEDDAISEEHLDVTAITGNAELSAVAADDDVLLVYDTSAGAIKKIARSNISLQAPTVTSISPTNALTGDGTGNFTIVITGTKFDATATATFINASGTTINPTSSTRNSATQITAVIAKSSLPDSGEPYDIKVSNGNGLNATLDNALNINAQPVYTTSAGSVGTVTGGSAITAIDIVATDPESAGGVTFEFQSGALPAGLSSAVVNENGVSKFRITGTPTNPASNTTTNFTLRAVDAASNTTSRAFSILVNRNYSRTSFTSSGTFSVPVGVAIVNVLVVAGGGTGGHPWGGGGGAGGLIYMPEAPVTPGGTVAITVGCAGSSVTGDPGGPASPSGSDSVFGASPSPGTPAALTAKGGGGGGKQNGAGTDGGSGGGAGRDRNSTSHTSATQPTQPGNSGAYGFGNAGGAVTNSPYTAGGGGGGAGAAGGQSGTSGAGPTGDGGLAGDGGVGKAYTIADGTTSVFYAGGGGGSRIYNSGPLSGQVGGLGGQGGGGNGAIVTQPSTTVRCTGAGSANKGGGGGGGACVPSFAPGVRGYSGGKGIVIVEY